MKNLCNRNGKKSDRYMYKFNIISDSVLNHCEGIETTRRNLTGDSRPAYYPPLKCCFLTMHLERVGALGFFPYMSSISLRSQL